MGTTALTIITHAYQDLGVLGEGTPTPSAYLSQTIGFPRLNNLLDSWGAQPATFPFTARLTFALTAGKGTEAHPYTIGPGGDFDTARPLTLEGAGLILGGLPETATSLELPRGVFTDDSYEATSIKALQTAFPTGVYYRPTYAGGLGTIILWPVPNVSDNALALYVKQPVSRFADLATTSYTWPYGYEEALQYNLGPRLAAAAGVDVPAPLAKLATDSLLFIKRANATLVDLPTDPALTRTRRGGYNILSGQGGF